MSALDSISIHRTLGLLMGEAARIPSLEGELARARREFFGAGASTRDPVRQLAAETRFAEWYLLERESEVLGEVPLRRLARGMTELPGGHEALLDSTVSVFRVEGANEVVVLRDLQDRALHEMERTPLLQLSPGDLVVGRLFPGRGGYAVPSAAVAVKTAADELAGAFESDLMSLGLDRRLSQVEIEHLLFRRWEVAEARAQQTDVPAAVERELHQLLDAHGIADPTAAEISAALRDAPHPGAVVGLVLDHAAFDTDVDLEEMRLLLLRLWSAHAGQAAAVAPAPECEPERPPPPVEDAGQGLGERLARRIEAGRAHHEDMAKVFEDVAEMLGEDLADDEPEPGDAGAAFAGDLEPLIGEFLWEEDCAGGPEAEILAALLRQQQEAPLANLDLESLAAADLLRLVLRVYLETPPAERQERVEHTFAVLARFCRWAQRTQDYALDAAVEGCREGFVADLPRLHRASLELSTAGAPTGSGRPRLWRVLEAGEDDLVVVPLDGSRPLTVAAGAAALELRAGDLLLAVARREPRGAGDTASLSGLVLALPAAAESLLG